MGQGIVIAGTHSGCGKTTITLGVLAALKKKGLTVQSFKAGPDFIDAGLHRLITGRPSRNLDLWMCGSDYVKSCFDRHSQDADISVVEGVMGFYDGGNYSTARLAKLLRLPVILVVDAYAMAESAGAVVRGFTSYNAEMRSIGEREHQIVGVIFNRIASEHHYERVKSNVHDVPVLGYLPRDLNFEIPNRHLGLTVAEENPITGKNIERLAEAVLEHIDMNAIEQQCIRSMGVRAYGCMGVAPIPRYIGCSHTPILEKTTALKIAVAYDRAFCFYYEDNLDLLKNAGAEIVTFSPISDSNIPDNVDALYIGGGYPELHAKELSQNTPMLESIRSMADSGCPIYAECGGLMYLSQGIHDFDDNFFAMAGVFPFETQMKKKRLHLGYRNVLLQKDCIIGKKGDKIRGHEFHYSSIAKQSNRAEEQRCSRSMGVNDTPMHPYAHTPIIEKTTALHLVYSIKNNKGEYITDEGYRYKNTLASYIHIHFGSSHNIAQEFISFLVLSQKS